MVSLQVIGGLLVLVSLLATAAFLIQLILDIGTKKKGQ